MTELLEQTRHALDLTESEAPTKLALAKLVARGLPVRSLEGLMARGIPKADVYRVVAPKRTVERRQAQKRLSPSESDRTERLARIFALASTVLGNDDRAISWLSTKKRRLEDERPLDLMESSLGADLVESVLLQAYFGNVA